MGWRAAVYDQVSSGEMASENLQSYESLCRWIRERAEEDPSVTIHVVAPHDATSDQLMELRRAGVRVSFAT